MNPEVLENLVTANHILANEGVVDAYGHVSIRHPDREDRFLLSCSRSPELVQEQDIMEFELDGTDVNPGDRKPYLERFIHGAIYEKRPEIQSVVHNHAYEVLPFGVTDTPIRPVFHSAGRIGQKIPVWNIRAESCRNPWRQFRRSNARTWLHCRGNNPRRSRTVLYLPDGQCPYSDAVHATGGREVLVRGRGRSQFTVQSTTGRHRKSLGIFVQTGSGKE